MTHVTPDQWLMLGTISAMASMALACAAMDIPRQYKAARTCIWFFSASFGLASGAALCFALRGAM
jgi:hypothetical protein